MPHIAAKHKPTPSHSAGDAACAEPASPPARIMVCGSKFGSGPAGERKQGQAPSLEDHLNHCGLGRFQYNIFIMVALIVAADGMEMTVISLLRKPLSDEWALNDDNFSLLGSTVFLGLLIGNLIGGYLISSEATLPISLDAKNASSASQLSSASLASCPPWRRTCKCLLSRDFSLASGWVRWCPCRTRTCWNGRRQHGTPNWP